MRFGGRERVSLILSHRFDRWFKKRGNARLVRLVWLFLSMKHAVEVVYGEV